jgi:hypothetical protein
MPSARCGYARRSRPWPGRVQPGTLAGEAGAAVPRAVEPRRAGGCYPQCGMVGIGNRDLAASSPAGTPSPAPAPRVGNRSRHDRSPDRQSPGRGRPALARTPAPRTHGNLRIPPSAAAHCRPGTPPVRPHSITWCLATLRDRGRFRENAHRPAALRGFECRLLRSWSPIIGHSVCPTVGRRASGAAWWHVHGDDVWPTGAVGGQERACDWGQRCGGRRRHLPSVPRAQGAGR